MHAGSTWKVVAGLVVVGGVAGVLASASAGGAARPDDGRGKASYAMGVAMARSLQKQGGPVDVDVDLVARGMKDALAGGRLLFAEDELRAVLAELQAGPRRAANGVLEANRRRGDAFLAENAKRDGVKVLPSGLQYRVLSPGHGGAPRDGDVVRCRYRGARLDGAEIDSSDRRGKPTTVKVSSALPAWREALQLMPVGSRWQLFVPSRLAYGDGGARSRSGLEIAPGEALVFELELLEVEPGLPR